jgi:hypothetical protein
MTADMGQSSNGLASPPRMTVDYAVLREETKK